MDRSHRSTFLLEGRHVYFTPLATSGVPRSLPKFGPDNARSHAEQCTVHCAARYSSIRSYSTVEP